MSAWMTTSQVAKRLGFHRQTLWRWCEQGRIEGAHRAPGRAGRRGEWKIPAAWVDGQLATPAARDAAPELALSVYVIRCAVTGLRKIGVSADAERRFTSLRTQSPTGPSMSLEAVVPGSLALEQELHARFAGQREHGEWFRLSDDDVVAIREGT